MAVANASSVPPSRGVSGFATSGAKQIGCAPLGWLTPFRSISRYGLGNGKNEPWAAPHLLLAGCSCHANAASGPGTMDAVRGHCSRKGDRTGPTEAFAPAFTARGRWRTFSSSRCKSCSPLGSETALRCKSCNPGLAGASSVLCFSGASCPSAGGVASATRSDRLRCVWSRGERGAGELAGE